MKVAFFNYLPLGYGGGLAQYYLTISNGLKDRYPSFDSEIVSLDERFAKQAMRMYSVFYFRNESLKFSKRPGGIMAKNIQQLGRLFQGFDLIYSKNDLFDLTLLKLACFGKKMPPIIVGFHTPIKYQNMPTIQAKEHNILYSSLYYKSLLKQAAGFHVLNAFHEKQLKKLFPKKTVKKIHNPVDSSIYKVVTKKKSETLKLLWVGRLTKDKGCDDLVKLVKTVGPRRVHWTIIGGGAMKKIVANLAKSCNNVTYFERMDHKKLAIEYGRHNVFVSTSKWECLPYTVLESQFSGVPVIGYKIAGVDDIVVHKKTGILVNNFDNMVKSIEQFSPSQFSPKNIRLVALKRFNPESAYNLTYSFFTEIYEESLR